MAKVLSEEHEALYQMICSLKSEDIHKVVSYVSFLRFVDVYKDKAMADLLKIEIAKSDQPRDELDASPGSAVDAHILSPLGLLNEDEVTPDVVDSLPLATPQDEFLPIDESVPEPAKPSEEISVAIAQVSSVQRLRLVVKRLHLNFTDVAFLFQISLPTARMWYSGAMSFGAEEEMQLKYFLEVSERVENMDIPRFDQVMRYPMPDGELFLEKLKDRKITDENFKTLQEAAERTEELRRKFKGATKPFHSMQNAIGLYATPLHCEE